MTDRLSTGFETRPGERQFVKFTFFKAVPEWRRLDAEERDGQIREFAGVVADWSGRNLVRC